ncbi:glycosyltransferase family 2 protein [Kutzneria kofuensis]|uniref:GT2 family glycosyltransferase n=1 Tax=Kutzneria kofuensis TaxID=103725 RepID=A0A7W9KIE6_9PSEU|nr:glycosyltransferase family 2 protein [Kutzneria kofuensis]MBB5893022.1 GT2 family glycosyltransferase [Kutzneria kofuensis]
MTRVMVAVVTYNSAADLPRLVASLPAGLEGVDWRLVVADNGSSDDTVEVIRRVAPQATVVETGANLGYAAGVNACAELAEPDEALFVLNADVVLERGCVRALLRTCSSGAVGIAVPLVTRSDGVVEPTLRRRPTAARVLAETVLGAHAGPLGERVAVPVPPRAIDVDWANGAVLLIPADVRLRIGKWQEDLFLYSEEVDYCRRVVDAGWRVRQCPAARAVHRGGDVTTSPLLWAQLITNKVVHVARWEGRGAAELVWATLLLAQLVRLPLRRGIHRRALLELWRGRRVLLTGVPTNPAAPPEFRRRIPVTGAIGGRA